MTNSDLKSIREKLSVDFQYLPGFAAHILHNEFEHFVNELLNQYEKLDISFLRIFATMDPAQRRSLAIESNREMLGFLAANEAGNYIQLAISNWLTNQLPRISREQIDSQDITLVNYARGCVFRKLISTYTSERSLGESLVEDVQRFIAVLDSQMFSSYLKLQKEEIHKINDALHKREQQLLEAQEIGQVGSFEWDLVAGQSSYTPQVFKIFEVEGPDNLVAFLRDVHPDDRERLRKSIEQAFVEGDYTCEYRYVRNGIEKVLLSRGKVVFQEGVAFRMIGTIADVTERHQIVRQLQESEKLHKQAQALTHIGNWSWIIGDNTITWSDEMYRIYGLEPQSEAITFERFLLFIHPEDREIRKAEIQRSMKNLRVEEYHFRIQTANGINKVLRGKGEVLADSDGKVRIMLGTCQDVSREFSLTQQLRDRERYLEQLNQSLQHANHELSRTNEELESFNFIASHDLQEPLRKIQVYSNRILETDPSALSGKVREYFYRINRASGRMQKLIEDFLAFAQTFKVNEEKKVTNLNLLLEEVKAEFVTRIEDKEAVITAGSLPTVYAVPFQIKQLLTNLISNALKYSKPDVPPRIQLTGGIVNASDVPEQSADKNLKYMMVSVRDNGIGFEPKYSSKIFELFQRLHSKNEYSGTGIGLALCKKIVRNLDGFIVATGEPGMGSVFTIYIPVRHPGASISSVDVVERTHQSR